MKKITLLLVMLLGLISVYSQNKQTLEPVKAKDVPVYVTYDGENLMPSKEKVESKLKEISEQKKPKFSYISVLTELLTKYDKDKDKELKRM